MREFINRYGVAVISAAVILAAVIWYFFGTSSTPKTGRTDVAYFIDEATGEESIQSSLLVPPLAGKGGQMTVVQVMKISCQGGRNAKVAYYRKFAPRAKEKITELRSANDPRQMMQMQDWMTRGEMIRLPAKDSPWVASAGPDGDKIRESVQCTNGQPAIAVFPP